MEEEEERAVHVLTWKGVRALVCTRRGGGGGSSRVESGRAIYISTITA